MRARCPRSRAHSPATSRDRRHVRQLPEQVHGHYRGIASARPPRECGSMVRKRGSTSMKTGRWPAATMARTSEGSVNKGSATPDPGGRSSAASSKRSACRPLRVQNFGTVAQQGERLRQRSAFENRLQRGREISGRVGQRETGNGVQAGDRHGFIRAPRSGLLPGPFRWSPDFGPRAASAGPCAPRRAPPDGPAPP